MSSLKLGHIRTNHYNTKQPQYNNSMVLTLPFPSNDTIEIITHSKRALQKIYKTGYQYHKVGIILSDFVSDKVEQMQLFNKTNYNKSDKLMKALDSINSSLGRNTFFIGALKIKNTWKTKSEKKSPNYTTSIEELPIIKC